MLSLTGSESSWSALKWSFELYWDETLDRLTTQKATGHTGVDRALGAQLLAIPQEPSAMSQGGGPMASRQPAPGLW